MTRLLTVLLAGCLLFFGVSVVHFAREPLRIEENEWPPMAQAVYDHGKPVLPADETHRLRFTPDLAADRDARIGAWHPPLYLYTLAVAVAVTGSDDPALLRGVGVAGLLAACVLLALIAREVAPRRWPWVAGGGIGLLLLHPYAIQGSTFLDIDTSVYAPLILLVLWLAVRFGSGDRPLGRGQVVALASALAFVLWTKMTTAIALVGVVGVWWLWTRGPRRAGPELIAIVGSGAALFFGTYALWCAATGIPFSYTFDSTFAQKSGRLGDTRLIDQAVHWHAEWFLPALLVLVAVYGIDLGRHLVRSRRPRPMDLLWLFGVGVLIQYVILSPTESVYQGKYAFPALPALVLCVAWLLLREARPWPMPRGPAVAGALAAGALAVAFIPDLITDQRYGFTSAAGKLAIVAGSAAVLLVGWRLARGPGVVAVCALLFAAQSVRSYSADTSPMYPISDTAQFQTVVREVNAMRRPGDIVFAAKDAGFYIHGPVVEGEDALAWGDVNAAHLLRADRRVRTVVSTSFGPPFGPRTTKVIEDCFHPLVSLGREVVRARKEGECRS